MLSGIAHDPIQRDVFTPIYFGASIYIPDGEPRIWDVAAWACV